MKKKLIITTAVLAIIAVIVVAVYFTFKGKIEKARKENNLKPVNPSTSDKIIDKLFPREQNDVIQSNNARNSFNIEKISSVNQVPIGISFPSFKDWKEKYKSASKFTDGRYIWMVETRRFGVYCVKAPCPSVDTYYLIYVGPGGFFTKNPYLCIKI